MKPATLAVWPDPAITRFRMTEKFRMEWTRLLISVGEEERDRRETNRRGEEAFGSSRDRVLYVVAMRVCDRWEAAGFTSATLVDGLPQPERPHTADWRGEGRVQHCSVCARPNFRRPPPATCDGPSGFDLVMDALARGVPFGLRDGLPIAGVPLVTGDVVVKLARAACRPIVREERKAA